MIRVRMKLGEGKNNGQMGRGRAEESLTLRDRRMETLSNVNLSNNVHFPDDVVFGKNDHACFTKLS